MSERARASKSLTPRLLSFLGLNVLAIGLALAIFFLVRNADGLTWLFASSWRWLYRHEVIMVLLASSPFFAALLVGLMSFRKARRNRPLAVGDSPKDQPKPHKQDS